MIACKSCSKKYSDVPEEGKDAIDKEIDKNIKRLREIEARIGNLPNCVSWKKVESGEKAGYLIRQFISRSLYDRISTRPFLTVTEKKWICFQLMKALADIHKNSGR